MKDKWSYRRNHDHRMFDTLPFKTLDLKPEECCEDDLDKKRDCDKRYEDATEEVTLANIPH